MTVERSLQLVSILVYGSLAVASLRLLRRRNVRSTRWLAVTFGSLAAVLLLGAVLQGLGVEGQLPGLGGRLLVAAAISSLLLFPYALHRFSLSFGRTRRRWVDVLVTASFAVLALLTFVIDLPEEGDQVAPLVVTYFIAFLVFWAGTFTGVTVRLWRGARDEPTVARRRMRLMAVAALLMTLTLLLSTTLGQQEPGSALSLLVQLLGYVAALLFYLGFATPVALKRTWRQPEERALRQAEAGLLIAQTPLEAIDPVLFAAAAVLGGRNAAVFDQAREVVAARGFEEPELEAIAGRLPEPGAPPMVSGREVVVGLGAGWLAVEASRYTPFFGDEEVQLLGSLGISLQLALERIRLDELERQARRSLEARNEEIQALVYGLSHDLRNPIVTVLGYVDVLQHDAAAMNADQRHYLERIVVSARYMDALISDLLELSRIGRTDRETGRVELGPLVKDIGAELERAHPAATVRCRDLPVIAMNPVRARQLLTNLAENAIRHGQREDITVTVAGGPADDGMVEVEVADDGAGIPPDYREKVFGMFERLEAVDVRSRGSGIGLTMCRKIVEDVGGTIRVGDSDTGARLIVTLPAWGGP